MEVIFPGSKPQKVRKMKVTSEDALPSNEVVPASATDSCDGQL